MPSLTAISYVIIPLTPVHSWASIGLTGYKVMAKAPTVQQFFKTFPDDDSCLEHLMFTRYGEFLDCPNCGKHGKFHRRRKRPVYECQWCSYDISPMVGTPFESSHTPLQKWFYAMYLFTNTRHGVPAKELQRQLGVTYKTAWRMGHEIRKYMAKTDGDTGLSGHVEVDETPMLAVSIRANADVGPLARPPFSVCCNVPVTL